MADATQKTSPARNIARPPDPEELRQLADWLLGTGAYEPDDARMIAEAAFVAVYDGYSTGGPGYCGKLMSVVWDGAPSFYDVFIWRSGQMERCGREYDEKECDRCGGKNGTLCWGCWRQYSHTGELLEACEQAQIALHMLSNHPAFAGDAPEFNESGIGYEACDLLRRVIAKAKGNAA